MIDLVDLFVSPSRLTRDLSRWRMLAFFLILAGETFEKF